MQLPMQYTRRESFGMIAGLFVPEQSISVETRSYRPDPRTHNYALITKAKAGKYKAEIVTAREVTGKASSTPEEVARKTGADFCCNGSFFENDYSPSGLFVRRGRVAKPFTEGKGYGILFTDRRGNLHLAYRNEYEREMSRGGVSDAVQMILLRHRSPLYTYDWNAKVEPQNLVGLTAEGDFLDVIFKDTNLTRGDMFMTPRDCTDIGALDSGPRASAYGNGINSKFGKQELEVANFLVIHKI